VIDLHHRGFKLPLFPVFLSEYYSGTVPVHEAKMVIPSHAEGLLRLSFHRGPMLASILRTKSLVRIGLCMVAAVSHLNGDIIVSVTGTRAGGGSSLGGIFPQVLVSS
jgi:hypothetical protein